MRWHSPRRFGVERGDIVVIAKDGLDKEDWLTLVLLPPYAAMAAIFAAVPFVPSPGTQEPVLFWCLLGAAIGGAVAVAGVRWIRRYLGSLGRWQIGPDGIEFNSARGPAHRLAWREVARVRWFRSSFELEGPPGTIELTRGGVPDEAWARVRSAVEAALTPRFDLAEDLPPSDTPAWHFPIAASLPCLLIAAEFLLLRSPGMSLRSLNLSLFGMLALLAVYCTALFVWCRREWVLKTWRYPRPRWDGSS